ncbi:MAG: Ltp family lipoprotein [Clostridium sp.]
MKKLRDLFKKGKMIEKIFMIITPIILVFGIVEIATYETTSKPGTSTVENVNKEKTYAEEIEKIDKSTSGTFKGKNHAIVIKDENNDGKLEVSISLDAEDNRFNETIWCAINGLSQIDGIKKYHSDLDTEISAYNLDFYAEGVKKYSSVFDNTVSGDIASINLISTQTNESTVVTRDEITIYQDNKAKEEANKKAEAERIEAEKKAESNKKAQKDLENSNCIRSAKKYIAYTAFSRSGLISQLEYEGYSNESAIYSVDSLSIDWNEQSAKMAKKYLDYTAFSRSGLYDQLAHEGFSDEQIQYGLSKVGY